MTILSLHFLIGANMWDEASQKLARNPYRVKLLVDGCLPLHLACEKNAPIGFIRELVSAHPDALSTDTFWGGRTPRAKAIQFYDSASPDYGDLLQLLNSATSGCGQQHHTPCAAVKSAPQPKPPTVPPGVVGASNPSLMNKFADGVARAAGRRIEKDIAGNMFATGSGSAPAGVAVQGGVQEVNQESNLYCQENPNPTEAAVVDSSAAVDSSAYGATDDEE